MKAIRVAAKLDKQAWVTEQLKAIGETEADGHSRLLWGLVRKLSGRRTRGPRSAAVMRGKDGAVLSSPEEVAAAWADHFFDEFRHNGVVAPVDAPGCPLQFSVLPPVASPLSREQWADELWRLASRLRGGSAAGLDGLPPELYRHAGAGGLFYVLGRLAELAFSQGVPEQWRGGRMAPVPKVPAAGPSLDNARGVLLSAVSGKLFAKKLRSVAAPALARHVGDSQQGAVSGGGTAAPALTVAFFIERARQSKGCAAVLFADLRTAFYTSLPELSLGVLLGDGERAASFAALGLTEEEGLVLSEEHLVGLPLIEACGVEPAFARAIRDWHQRTWFTVEQGDVKTFPRCGVRPGDPLADVTFCLSYSCVLLKVRQAFEQANLTVRVQLAPGGIFDTLAAGGARAVDVVVPPPTYMDDSAFLVEGASPEDVLEKLAKATSIVHRIASSYGGILNFKVGKTEGVLACFGPGAGAAKALLEALEVQGAGGSLAHLLPFDGGHLRLVTQYKHLGLWRRYNGGLGREIAHRAGSALAATACLARRCLSRSELPPPDRVMVARVCAHSRLLHMAGGWPLLSATLFKKVAISYHKPLRVVCGANGIPEEGFVATSNEAVRQECKVLPIEWALVFARLRMAARLSSGPCALRALIQSAGGAGWRLAVQWSLRCMANLLRDKLVHMPCPLASPASWEELWTRFPGPWQGLLQLAQKRVLADPWAAAVVMQACPLLCAGRVEEMGGSDAESEDEHVCMVCGVFLASAVGAHHHLARAHGRGADTAVRPYCFGSACPVCATDLRTRLRLVAHLRSRPAVPASEGRWRRGASGACREALLAGGYPRMDEDQMATAAEQDRALRRACRLAGLSVQSADGFACRAPAAGGGCAIVLVAEAVAPEAAAVVVEEDGAILEVAAPAALVAAPTPPVASVIYAGP